MKAYLFENAADGLVSVDVADPTPGPEEVVIEIGAAGICQSDVHILNGHGDDWLRKRPIVLGHEVAGTVAELGSGVDGFAVGDRVAVALVSHPIEQADFAHAIGLGFDGGFAEKAAVPARNLVRVPDAVSFPMAAVSTDSVATSYHAVACEAGVTPGSTVAIIGLGGLGLNGVRFAALQQATVYGVDVNPATFDLARSLGAADCFASVADIPGNPDALVDFAGMGTTTAEAIVAVRPGGRVVVVGLGSPEATISTALLTTKNVQLKGSIGASLEDLEVVLAMIADGVLEPVLEEIAFADLTAGIERLERGEVRGRLFTRPAH